MCFVGHFSIKFRVSGDGSQFSGRNTQTHGDCGGNRFEVHHCIFQDLQRDPFGRTVCAVRSK